MLPKITWAKIATILAVITTVGGLIWRMEANHTDSQVKQALLEYRVQQLETQFQIMNQNKTKK